MTYLGLNLVKVPNPKVYGDLALLGDQAQGSSHWYHPNSEKGWQKSFFIYSKWYANKKKKTPRGGGGGNFLGGGGGGQDRERQNREREIEVYAGIGEFFVPKTSVDLEHFLARKHRFSQKKASPDFGAFSCLKHGQVSEGDKNRPGGPKYLQGAAAPLTPYFPHLFPGVLENRL